MEAQAFRYIVLAQLCFLVGLAVAIMLMPEGLRQNEGISYYGIFARTIGPYLFSLLGAAFFSWQAAMVLTDPKMKITRIGIAASSLFAVIIAVTPFSASAYIDAMHVIAGSALFSLQLLLSFWLAFKLRFDAWIVLLAAVEFIAGLACAVYLRPPQGFLIQFQIIFQVAFGLLLVLSLKKVAGSK